MYIVRYFPEKETQALNCSYFFILAFATSVLNWLEVWSKHEGYIQTSLTSSTIHNVFLSGSGQTEFIAPKGRTFEAGCIVETHTWGNTVFIYLPLICLHQN